MFTSGSSFFVCRMHLLLLRPRWDGKAEHRGMMALAALVALAALAALVALANCFKP